jgi:hypothetical protein
MVEREHVQPVRHGAMLPAPVIAGSPAGREAI